jgi:hypothetical protein
LLDIATCFCGTFPCPSTNTFILLFSMESPECAHFLNISATVARPKRSDAGFFFWKTHDQRSS